jgi:hypothetical protein
VSGIRQKEQVQWIGARPIVFGLSFVLCAAMLTILDHSRVEHDVVFAVELLLITFWLVVATAGIRARRRDHL